MNTPIFETRSNILGATGLPRAAVVALYRSRGLFGADSRLEPAEQAIVASRLPVLPGVPVASLPTFRSPRLAALADYVDARLAGREGRAERARYVAAGGAVAAAAEAATTVDNVSVVFGPARRQGTAVAAPKAAETQYARAA